MKNFYATIILTLSFINLAFSQTSSMDFYFDLDNFAIPKVYVFTNHERNQIEYWEFISDTSKNQLTSICYNSNLQEYNKFVEQYNDKKSIKILLKV